MAGIGKVLGLEFAYVPFPGLHLLSHELWRELRCHMISSSERFRSLGSFSAVMNRASDRVPVVHRPRLLTPDNTPSAIVRGPHC
jgi:hypothetical protein